MSKKRILVVDDEKDIREIIRVYLEEDGYEVIEAANGEKAILMAQTSKPDLITLDIMMPGMDGFEVGHVLKSNSQTQNIPIIILSILGDKKDYKLGIADYISKPFRKEELLSSVKNILGKLKDEGKPQKAKLILVVDDEPDVVDIIKIYLKEKGYLTSEAYDGLEAVNKVYEVKPDLIILDIRMPKLDGYEVIKRLKRDDRVGNIPIIVLTATRISAKEKELGLSLGAMKYLTKPFTGKQLIEEIEEALSRAG
jgi:DNA-binding response OmpR family regulator